ncbi:MAG: LPXTG cell wall anchor domain-containing protein, partial [Tissierellia bacterium]|nr:LPXTG cell wall anchor domain-containing protein [Tissierellia bacterium]
VDDRVYETVYDESTIRNTFLIQKIEVKAEKLWVNAPKWTPSIWFKLLRKTEDGKFEEVPGADLLKVKSGQVIWKEVDKTDLLGNPYTFSVQEVDKEGKDYVPEDYKKEENGLKVTNTYTKTKDKLPSTGESSIGLLLFSGFAFLGSGSMLLRKKKK